MTFRNQPLLNDGQDVTPRPVKHETRRHLVKKYQHHVGHIRHHFSLNRVGGFGLLAGLDNHGQAVEHGQNSEVQPAWGIPWEHSKSGEQVGGIWGRQVFDPAIKRCVAQFDGDI